MDNISNRFGYVNPPPANNSASNKKYFIVVAVIFAFAIVAFVVWLLLPKQKDFKIVSPFAKLTKSSSKSAEVMVEDPLTGVRYPKDVAQAWINSRPLGVMVNNFVTARPQSGLNEADVVYEVVAEGGITRFLAFYLANSPTKVGPIRSTREYYLVLAKEMGDAMLMHIGWSPQALIDIESWPVRSLIRLGLNCDQPLPDPTDIPCWRNKARLDADIPWEHTAYGNVSKLREAGNNAGWSGKVDNFQSWKFRDDKSVYSSKPSASQISIDFWNPGDYSAVFMYNPANNSYLRYTGYDTSNNPLPHKDNETQKQIEVTNFIVQFAKETAIEGDEKNRLDYELVGSGEALVFMDGKVIDSTWSKSSRNGRTVFYDTNGHEIQFNRGKFWISIVPDRNKGQVVYK